MSTFKLRDHQLKAVEEMFNGCILVGDVGSGKSATVAEYYARNESPRDVYVITTAKKRDSFDWIEEFVRVGVGTGRDATVYGVLVVDSWNNIKKYVDVKDAFFVFDEQRLVGSGAWTKSFYKIAKNNRWVLLSATPGDVWMDYIPVFVAHGFYKNKTEFLDRHVKWKRMVKYPAVERYLETGVLVRYRNKLLVDMPIERHTTRHLVWVDCPYDSEQLEKVTKKRWHVYENRPLRDVGEMFRVARKIVATDTSRMKALQKVISRHPRVIVFYNFDYELEQLRSLASEATTPSPSSERSPETSRTFSESEGSPDSTNERTTEPGRQPKRGGPTGPSCSTPEPPRSPSLGAKSRCSEPSSQPSSDGMGCTSSRGTTSTPTSTRGSSTASDRPSGSCRSEAKTEWAANGGTETGTPSKSLSETSFERSYEWKPSAGNKTSSTSGRSVTTTENPSTGSTCAVTDEPKTSQWPTSGVVLAEWNGHRHDPVPTSERWVYLVQYVAGSEGWNCVSTDAMVFYSLTYSYKNWYQAFGRIDRLNTPFTDLYYYALCSKSWIDQAVRKSLRAKKSFNESSFGRKMAW